MLPNITDMSCFHLSAIGGNGQSGIDTMVPVPCADEGGILPGHPVGCSGPHYKCPEGREWPMQVAGSHSGERNSMNVVTGYPAAAGPVQPCAVLISTEKVSHSPGEGPGGLRSPSSKKRPKAMKAVFSISKAQIFNTRTKYIKYVYLV